MTTVVEGLGLNRFKQGMTKSGKEIWACPECIRNNRGKIITINYETGKITVLDKKDTEVKMKCKTCGHVYCFNGEDLARNQKLAKEAAVHSIMGIGEAIGGTRIGSQLAVNSADAKLNQIIDYTRCPKCNSADVIKLSDAEWETEKNKATEVTPAFSAADEIRKFKDLLDSGIIIQEEFDLRKNNCLVFLQMI